MDNDLWNAMLRTAMLMEGMGPTLAGDVTAKYEFRLYGKENVPMEIGKWQTHNALTKRMYDELLTYENKHKDPLPGAETPTEVSMRTIVDEKTYELKKATEIDNHLKDEYSGYVKEFKSLLALETAYVKDIEAVNKLNPEAKNYAKSKAQLDVKINTNQ